MNTKDNKNADVDLNNPKKNNAVAKACVFMGASIMVGTFALSSNQQTYYDGANSSLLAMKSEKSFEVASFSRGLQLSQPLTSDIKNPEMLPISKGSLESVSDLNSGLENKTDIIVEEEQKTIRDNEVKQTSKEPVSTFSIDTDDGAYKLFSQQIRYGKKLSPDIIRPEEFINAFDYNYSSSGDKEQPFTTHLEILDSPWSSNKILKIGIKGTDVDFESLPPVNLVFLVDVSGSMSSELSKIKIGLKSLVKKLRPQDKISIVTYAGSTDVVLKSTEVENRKKIINAIDSLSAGGGTHGEAGIKLAYNQAESGFVKDGVNRILLISDGDFNVGLSGRHELKQLITAKRKMGVTFSTIGVSDDSSYRDGLMEAMANHGNGNYTFIDSVEDAREVFADRFASTLVNIAKDVKTQIEFNPVVVKEYRMIGYENRTLSNEDFLNDYVDSGELPSGMSATLMYEITLTNQKGLHPSLRYGVDKNEGVEVKSSDELAFLKIRYKEPGGDKSNLLTFPVTKDMFVKEPSDNSKFALAVAGFAQIAKQSKYVGGDYNLESVVSDLSDLNLNYKKGKFLSEVKTYKELD